MALKKSFNAQQGTGVLTIPITTTIVITHIAGSTGTVTVKDSGSGAGKGQSFTIAIGESVTLAWGWVNEEMTITSTAGSTARAIYYN